MKIDPSRRCAAGALVLLSALGALGAGGARAAAPAQSVPPVQQGVAAIADAPAALTRWLLDDGTHVFLIRMPRTPLIWMDVVVGAGSWSPWVRSHHGSEAFAAQLRDARDELAQEGDRLRAPIHVYMSRWASELSLQFVRGDEDAAIALLRKTLSNRSFVRNDLRRGKWAQAPLWASRQKEPRFLLGQAMARLFFAPEDMRRLQYEEPPPRSADVEELVRTRDALVSAPARLITFVGDLSQAEASRLAARILPAPRLPADLDAEPLAPRFFAETEQPRDTSLTLPRLAQTFFEYSRLSVPCTDPDYASLLVADTVLWGHSLRSRLGVALREQSGDSYEPSTWLPRERVAEVYSLRASTRTANAAQLEERLRATLRTFHQGGITAAELQKAREHLLNRRVLASDSPFARLAEARWEWERGLPQGATEALYARVARLSLEEVNAFIRRFFDPARFALARVGPPSRAPQPKAGPTPSAALKPAGIDADRSAALSPNRPGGAARP